MKRQISERTLWPSLEPMYPELSVTAVIPEPSPSSVMITLDGEYAQRLLRVLTLWQAQPFKSTDDVTILLRTLEAALAAEK